jgi:CheY-like chemotaxis protein
VNPPVRILVAEDNEDHLFFIVRALRDVNGVVFEVDAVRDGEEALDFLYRRGRFAAQPRPHLILLDLKMPKVDGLDVLERIKADPELKTIPITMLTSSDRKEDIDEAYRRGGNAYVLKQPSFTGLKQEIQAVSDYWTTIAVLPDPPN